MGFSFRQNHSLFTFSHIICMFGLILSQTHILTKIQVDYNLFHVPTFTLIYFVLSTAILLSLVINYAFFKGISGARAIDFFQHIGIGLSVILIRLLFGRTKLDSFTKVFCLLLFVLQCMLISVKIIYLGSVTKGLSQISGLTKLTRMQKLLLTAIIPQFISAELPLVIVLSVCELLTIFMFLFKYTYQKCSVQYVLLIGVLGGFISSIEDMLSTIFEYEYYFLGQSFIILIFLIPQKPLLSIFEIKYRLLFTGLKQNKPEDQHLAQILFLRECIFEKHQTLEISEQTKNEAILQISNMIEKTKKITIKDNDNNGELQQGSYIFLHQIQKDGVQLQQSFFQIYLSGFKQTSNFQTFSILIDCALELPKKYSIFAMILYYGFRERTIHKRSRLEQCRYEIIYHILLTHFCSQYRDKQQISFLQFSANLQKLDGLIENCFNDQIQLIQALTNDEKRSEMFIDTNLLKQYSTKQKIKNMLEVCFKSNLYLFSNQFKYIYLLYNTTIQKKYSQLRKDLKYRFLSVQAKSIQLNYYPRYLTVLSGFTNGQIIKCNQSFRNYFKFVINTQNKSTISELFPNDKQKRKHNSLMLEYMQQVCDQQGDHSKYECMLAVQAEINTFKVKRLQKFKIKARIYCQNQQGFNYVCQFIKIDQKNEDIITILKKERDVLEKKCLNLYAKNMRFVCQLDDKFQICDIEGDFRNQSFASCTKLSNKGQKQIQPEAEINHSDTCLNEKIKLIEQKIIQEKRLKKTKTNLINIWMIAQLIIILMLCTLIGTTYLKLQNQVNSLSFALKVQVKAIRQANLIRNRIMVEKLILNMVKGTQYFPDYVCIQSQMRNLTSYFIKYMSYDTTENFDDYINLIVSPNLDDNLLPKMYSNRYSSVPYLFNYQNNITFQKYLYLLKSKEIQWLGQLINGSKVVFDQKYYSSIFPTELMSYSIFSNNSLYSLDNLTASYYSNLLATTNQLKIIFLIANAATMFILIFFRIKDTMPLMDILSAFESIDNKILIPKLKQLKYSLSLLRKIKTVRIMSLKINSKGFITIENDKQKVQNKMVQNFTKQKKTFYKNNDDDGYNQRSDQNTSFLRYNQVQNSHGLPKSTLIRAVLYNKCYWFILLILMGSIIASCTLFIDGFASKIKALQNFEDTDEKLSLLNQKYINLVAFNWLKAYSLTSKTFDMTLVNTFLNNSLQTLKAMSFQKLFYKNYPSDLANQILYSNACKYFLTPSLCAEYRAGAFNEGISIILPLTLKQQIQGTDISSTDYTYFIPHICDNAYVFFQGIVPINKKIPSYGLQAVLGDTDKYLLIQACFTSVTVGILFTMTIIWQIIRNQKQYKVAEEVLSMDTVSNLYHISDLKPYFNKIYYA